MKTFIFSHKKSLEYHEQLLKKLNFEMFPLVSELKLIENDINILNEKLQHTSNDLKSKMSKAISAMIMKTYKSYMDKLLIDIDEREQLKKVFYDKIENKKIEIIDKNKEVFEFKQLEKKELEKYKYSLNNFNGYF